MSLPSMPVWGPLMPIQRPTLAEAAAAGVSSLNSTYFLTQSVNIQLKHMGGLQCLLVSLPGLPEGFVVLVVSSQDWEQDVIWQLGHGVATVTPLLPSSNMAVPSSP